MESMADIFNKSQYRKKLKRFKNKKAIVLILLILLNISLPGILINVQTYSLNNPGGEIFQKRNSEDEFAIHTVTDVKVQELNKAIEEKREQERIQAEIEHNTQKIEAILARYNSPMQGYGHIIARKAYECGGDYRVLTAIAGNESGFGRIPYKLYNPYGYLDGVQYSGWDTALEFLSCVISQRFLKPCNNDLACIIRTYGGSDTNKEQWIRNIQFFINQINQI